VGKLLLLNYSNGELDALINEKGLPRFTKNTLSTREDLMAEIAVTRRRDYAVDDEECEMGARCIAVPLRDYTSRIVAAISVTGPTFRMDSKLQENKLSTLMEAGALLSRRLGYNAFAGDSATVI
jgi:DNA-binding IclR family transcriptional regulator